MPRTRPVLLVALALLLPMVLLATACSDDDEPTATGGTSTTAGDGGGATSGPDYGATTGGGDGGATSDTPSVVAQGLAFAGDLTVAPGEEFILDNQDGTTHTLTADDGAFDSGDVAGASRSDPMAAPDEPGDYAFHCEIHSSMTGTLTVEG
jgi:plastocyanin